MRFVSSLVYFIVLFVLVACVSTQKKNEFVLSDDSALRSVAATKLVIALKKKYPNTIFFIEDGSSENDRMIYLGFDEGTHTTRHSFLRVDDHGVVYENKDLTFDEIKWVVLK